MRLILAHFRAETMQWLRIPIVVVASVLFPGLFFIIFGLPNADSTLDATFIMASFTIYAVLGIAIIQFGVSIAEDRTSTWEGFLRILPVAPLTRFTARVLMALLFAVFAGGLVILLSLMLAGAHLSAEAWLPFGAVILLGSIPFALMGITIGYWLTPKAALPIANIISFLLSFGGGLWIPPRDLPSFVASISPYLPTRQYGDLAWAAVLGHSWPATSWLGLMLYTLLFGLLAIWGYWRDEGQRFR